MQVVKPLDKTPRPLKYYSSNPDLKKPVNLKDNEKKIEFKQTFLNPC